MKQQRRGWLWLVAGIILALVAGVFTFRIINDVTTATRTSGENRDTVQVLVANEDIQPYARLAETMFAVKDVPRSVAPIQAVTSMDQIANKFTVSLITAGELIMQNRLVDPADPNAPLLYTIDKDKVLMAIPSDIMLGKLGILQVGNHIDIAYTAQLVASQVQQSNPDEQQASQSGQSSAQDKTLPVTFVSLQNLEIKALPRQAGVDDKKSIVQPDAILLALSAQDALILKYLLDTGASMEIFLRAPGDDALAPILPVDERFLIERFQLHLDAPVDQIRLQNATNSQFTFGDSLPVTTDSLTQGSGTQIDSGQGEVSSAPTTATQQP